MRNEAIRRAPRKGRREVEVWSLKLFQKSFQNVDMLISVSDSDGRNYWQLLVLVIMMSSMMITNALTSPQHSGHGCGGLC
jgi:hypothetical protein